MENFDLVFIERYILLSFNKNSKDTIRNDFKNFTHSKFDKVRKKIK